MVTMIHRLFQHLYIVLISIISIFNISLIYLIDVNDEDNMDDHDENAINESMYKYSETVTEIPLDPVIDLQSRQIPDCIVHNNNQNYIRLGKTRPCHRDPTNIVENSNNAAEKPDELLSCFKKFFLDILNDEQSRQQHLLNDQAISATTSIDILSDQIIQDEDKIDDDEMILPTYSMSTHFRKKRNPVCPIQG
ncbi:unnamed protein product [Rotaria sp. Silwood1]|nr:unnamed protein product [Rotaria sp. Silwood1]CAF3735535.1 unnamed protein product [Rotaria sp. Silwood1]CAF5021217.1 unnamed protein product [Rotaria sp. Silwood1]